MAAAGWIPRAAAALAGLALAAGCGSDPAAKAAAAADTTGQTADAAVKADGGAAGDIGKTDADVDTHDGDAAAAPSKKPPVCPANSAPVSCFHKCQPAGNAAAPVTPSVPACGDAYTGLTWATADGKPSQPPSLTFSIGTSDPDTGAFVPYQIGGAATPWAAIVEGVQGGVHIWAAVRVPLPPGTPTKVVLEVAGHALMGDGAGGCKVVATELVGTSKVMAVAEAGQPGWWTNASKLVAGVPVAFEQNVAAPYCGQWVRLVVEVREPKSGVWGRQTVDLRLWDLDNL